MLTNFIGFLNYLQQGLLDTKNADITSAYTGSVCAWGTCIAHAYIGGICIGSAYILK